MNSASTKPRGRRPGSLCRFKCRVCGAVELVRGGSNTFRCSACRGAGLGLFGRRAFEWLGKDRASRVVHAEISRGAIPHPTNLRCADCDAPAMEYEHRDYNRPLAIEPICRSCNLKRGPAIPMRGAVEAVLARGLVPYTTRRAFEKLCATLGAPEAAHGIERTKLTLEDWRERWPMLAHRIPDPAWPHPDGRPAIDVAAPIGA